MTIKQCYQAMGADFEEISQRIPSEAMIRKFAVKFPEDKSFAELTKALEQGDVETAFRAAHTIKGLCLTLGFSHLTAPASELTELLRRVVADGTRSVLFSTHIPSDLEKCASHITFIKDGAIFHSSTVAEFMAAYADRGATLEDIIVSVERRELDERAII